MSAHSGRSLAPHESGPGPSESTSGAGGWLAGWPTEAASLSAGHSVTAYICQSESESESSVVSLAMLPNVLNGLCEDGEASLRALDVANLLCPSRKGASNVSDVDSNWTQRKRLEHALRPNRSKINRASSNLENSTRVSELFTLSTR